MLRVLTLATLFPDASRPRFGPFIERQTIELAAHPDVELRVFAPVGIPPWPLSKLSHYRALSNLPAREAWKGLDVYRPRFFHIPGTQGRFDAALLARALLPMLHELRPEFPFDVIDAEFFFPDGPAAVDLGKALRVPVSVKARGADIHYWGMQPATRGQVTRAGRYAHGTLAVSAAIKADMVAMGMPEDRIRVHYTGVDLDLFKPLDRATAKAGLGIKGSLIVSVGALIPRKGQAMVIDALPALPDTTLVLIGAGAERAAFEARGVAHGVSDRLRFTGAIGHEELAHWLGAADAMVLASASEGLANAWVEALACGTPIVITDVGGAREVVQDPVAGHLVAADSRAIAAAVAEILAHPRDPAQVRQAAERFTWAANTAALYDHLKSLI